MLESLRLSDRLLRVRDTQRDLARHAARHSDREPWPAPIRALMDAIQKHRDETGEKVLDIAVRAAKNAEAKGRTDLAIGFLAAGVELIDPTPTGD